MGISLETLACPHCGSRDLLVIWWDDELKPFHSSAVDWRRDIPPEIIEVLQDERALRLVVRCATCGRMADLRLELRDLPQAYGPFSDCVDPELSVTLGIATDSLMLTWCAINGYRVDIHAATHSCDNITRNVLLRQHPFYPYPLGVWEIQCASPIKIGGTWLRSKFTLSRRSPIYIDIGEGEFSAYSAAVEETDEPGFDLLVSLHHDPALGAGGPALSGRQGAILTAYTGAGASVRVDRERVLEAAWIARTASAYRFIHWLEQRAREYVNELYLNVYPVQTKVPDWWRALFPEAVRNTIKTARDRERALRLGEGTDWALAYADFDDLMTLIMKDDVREYLDRRSKVNWRAAIGHFEYVKQYRNAIAHARGVSHDGLERLQENAVRWGELLGMKWVEETPRPLLPETPRLTWGM